MLLRAAFFLCAFGLAAPAFAQAPAAPRDPGALMHPIPSPTIEAPPPIAPVAPGAAANISEGYILGTGDRIRLIVFGESNLSGEFLVDSTGRVALPLIGEVKADGMSLRQFETSVEDQLKRGYLNDPRVSVEVLNFRPFYILGEVARPGTYPYTSGLTVYNAVATAGGFTYRANTHSVKLKREGMDKELDLRLTPNLTLEPGDTLRIKERWY